MSTLTPPARHVEIGHRIRAARERKKMRQVDLAAAAKLSWRHLIRIEQGTGGEPKRDTIDRIADALGVEREELCSDDDDEESHPVSLDELLRLRVRQILREEARTA